MNDGHHIKLSGSWYNDGTAGLSVMCDPCPTGSHKYGAERFSSLYDDDGPLTFAELEALIVAHTNAGA